jgi:peptidoglycan/xylan/chitin deacetylase (PgdA/CDA1 family)
VLVRRGRSRRRCGPAALLATLAWLAQAAGPPASDAAAGGVVSHGSRSVPVVALTIDDGWSPSNCRRVARILLEKGVTATFFPVGSAVLAAPATWRWIASQGFPIGNHTATHAGLAGSWAVAYREIVTARRIIEGATGRPMIRVVRPPRGEWNGTTVSAAAAAGFGTVLLWDATFGDTGHRSDAAHRWLATRGTYGSVILMHCGPASSVRILPAVIDAYLARGIRFVTVPELLRLRAAPASWAGFARVQPGWPYLAPQPLGPAGRGWRVPHGAPPSP